MLGGGALREWISKQRTRLGCAPGIEKTRFGHRIPCVPRAVEPPGRHVLLDTGRDAETVADDLDRRFARA